MVRLGWRLTRRPGRAVAALCLAQIVLWTLTPALSHDAPPLDVVEGYLWGKHLPIATYKHPALPAVLLEMTRRLTGAIGWPAYLLSQCAVALTFVCGYLLGRETLGGQRSLMATLCLTGVYSFMWPSIEFNHNVAQMPIWAAMALALWRAVEYRSTGWWLLVALFAALGIYAKLSTVVFIGCAGIWVLTDARARACLKDAGPWLALVLLAALCAPLYFWLVENQFQPLAYAVHRGTAMGRYALVFVIEQVLAMTAMGLALTLTWIVYRPVPARARPWRTSQETRLLHFALLLMLGPVAVVVGGSLVSGLGLRGAWGYPALSFAGIAAVLIAGHRIRPAVRPVLAVMAAAFLLVTSLSYAAITVASPALGKIKRQNFPQAAIAVEMRRIYADATGRTLTIIATDGLDWPGALAGLSGDDMLDVASDPALVQTPWITRQRIEREGMLVVWEAGVRRVPESIARLAAGQIQGEVTFSVPRSPGGQKIVVGYAVIPPRQ